jgi:uncharacterized protein DUF4328
MSTVSNDRPVAAAPAPPTSLSTSAPETAGGRTGEDRLFNRLTTVLQWIFAGWVVFAAVGIAFRAMERSLLSRAAENRFSVARAEALASDQRIDIFAWLWIAAYIATAIVFIVWFYRAHRKAQTLGGEMRYSDGWAVGGWFIPIGNWWIPKKLANDIWWGTELAEEESQEHPALLTSWWLAWVLAGAIGWVFLRTGDVDNVDDGLRVNLGAIASLALSLLAAAFAVFVVRQIGQRLAERSATVAGILAADPATAGDPPGGGPELDATIASRPRRQPWRLIGATVASVAIAAGTVVIVTGTSGSGARRASSSDAGASSQPVDTAPPIVPGPAPPDFDRHESYADAFAISVPSSWTSVDLTAPDIDSTLEQLRRTSPFITYYLDQQEQAGARSSFLAIDVSPTGNMMAFPAQVEVLRAPDDGQSLDEGAHELDTVLSASPELIGTIDRRHIELPTGRAQVLSFKMRGTTPAGEAVFSKTVYALTSGGSAYVIALGANEDQAEANTPTFNAIIRSLEITR